MKDIIDMDSHRFGATDRGWKVRYIPLCLATGVCPPTPRSFFSQQMRWARGSTTLLTNGHFWVSNLTLIQKVCYLCGTSKVFCPWILPS